MDLSGNRWPAPKTCGVLAAMTARTVPNVLRVVAFMAFGWIVAVVATLALTGCGASTLRDLATERGAMDASVAACLLAHTYDGQFGDEFEVMRRFCGKREYLDPWLQEAEDIKRLVMAQRAGKVRPDAEPAGGVQ